MNDARNVRPPPTMSYATIRSCCAISSTNGRAPYLPTLLLQLPPPREHAPRTELPFCLALSARIAHERGAPQEPTGVRIYAVSQPGLGIAGDKANFHAPTEPPIGATFSVTPSGPFRAAHAFANPVWPVCQTRLALKMTLSGLSFPCGLLPATIRERSLHAP
jgi:hypothetical protein